MSRDSPDRKRGRANTFVAGLLSFSHASFSYVYKVSFSLMQGKRKEKGNVFIVSLDNARIIQGMPNLERYCARHDFECPREITEALGTNDGGRLRMIFLGAGGTGKSTVLKCLRDFAEKWDMQDTLCVTATTGIAAGEIGGTTWQAALGHSIHGSDTDKNKKNGSLYHDWSAVGIFVCDEVSMMDLKDVTIQNDRTQKLRDDKTLPFGGLHVIYCGDLYQLSAVFGQSVYCNPANGQKHLLEVRFRGQTLWRSFDTCVILQGNKRAKQDEDFASLLERARTNEMTIDDVNKINERVVTNSNQPPPGTQIVFPFNEDREAWNAKVARKSMELVGGEAVGYKARGFVVIGEMVTAPLVRQILVKGKEAWRNKTSHELHIMIGAPYTVTYNVDVPAGIANGTRCYCKGFTFVGNNEPEWNHATGMFEINVRHVKNITMQHHAQSPTRQYFDLHPARHSCEATLSKDFKRTFSYKQIGCVLSYGATGNSVQGRTMDSVLVANWSKHKYGNTGWLYVVISRVRTISSLFLMSKLPTDMTKFKVRAQVKQEMDRLEEIAKKTILRSNEKIKNLK